MELKDTIEMMNSEDYKERFKAEYHQLLIRARKLMDMLEKHKAGTLPFTLTCPRELLETQLEFMAGYLGVLCVRAELEGVILEDNA